MSKKLVVWALFDSETGDYTTTIHKYFDDKIDVYGVGLSHYGKDTDRYVNFNLADFSELFGGGQHWEKTVRQTSKAGYYSSITTLRKLVAYD